MKWRNKKSRIKRLTQYDTKEYSEDDLFFPRNMQNAKQNPLVALEEKYSHLIRKYGAQCRANQNLKNTNKELFVKLKDQFEMFDEVFAEKEELEKAVRKAENFFEMRLQALRNDLSHASKEGDAFEKRIKGFNSRGFFGRLKFLFSNI